MEYKTDPLAGQSLRKLFRRPLPPVVHRLPGCEGTHRDPLLSDISRTRFALDEGRRRCKGLFHPASKNPWRVAERLGRGGRVIKMME